MGARLCRTRCRRRARGSDRPMLGRGRWRRDRPGLRMSLLFERRHRPHSPRVRSRRVETCEGRVTGERIRDSPGCDSPGVTRPDCEMQTHPSSGAPKSPRGSKEKDGGREEVDRAVQVPSIDAPAVSKPRSCVGAPERERTAKVGAGRALVSRRRMSDSGPYSKIATEEVCAALGRRRRGRLHRLI